MSDHSPGSKGARSVVSFVPDIPALYDDLTVWEHMEFTASLHGVPEAEMIRRGELLLERFGLVGQRDELPRYLSRGTRQKTSLILGFLRPHRILLLDEPYEGLDREGAGGLTESIREELAFGSTVLVTGQRFTDSIPHDALTIDDGNLVSTLPVL